MRLSTLRYLLPVLVLGVVSSCGGSKEGAAAATDAGGDAGGSPHVILDGGGSVPPTPDGASLCPKGPCNYQTQSGCASNQSCQPLISGSQVTPACQRAGKGKSGAACTSWDQCAHGYLCAKGECHKLCCGGDWTACPSGQGCISHLLVPAGGKNVDSGASLCFPINNCDVLDPGSCKSEPGDSCQIIDAWGHVACMTAGQGKLGAPCSETVHCSAGFTCVANKCRRLCRAVAGGGDPSCPASEGICVHFNRDPVGVGECTPVK